MPAMSTKPVPCFRRDLVRSKNLNALFLKDVPHSLSILIRCSKSLGQKSPNDINIIVLSPTNAIFITCGLSPKGR